jgi:hypothetical protein
MLFTYGEDYGKSLFKQINACLHVFMLFYIMQIQVQMIFIPFTWK